MAHGEKFSSILHHGRHGTERKGEPRERSPQRPHHGDHTDDQRQHGEQRIEDDCHRLRSHYEEHRRQGKHSHITHHRDMFPMEEYHISKHRLGHKDERIGKQFAHHSQRPTTKSRKFIAPHGIERHQQHQYLKHDVEDRHGQIFGIVERGVIERMIIRGHGQEEGLDVLLRIAQHDGLLHDGSHTHGDERRLERTHHLATHGQQGIVVIVAQRSIRATHHRLLKSWRNGEVAIHLPPLHRLPSLRIVAVVSHHIKCWHRRDTPHDAARRSRVILIHDADGQTTHLSVTKDGGHEENQEQR